MADPLDFTGKTALIIGGSSGIGNGIAHAFKARGAGVHVTGTRASADDYSADEGSHLSGLTYHHLDVMDRNGADTLAAQLGAVDTLVLSQGAVRYGRAEFAQEGWDDVVQVNLNSVMDCARAFHAGLSAKGGNIIIVSSVAAFKSTLGTPAYAASKAGAASLTKTLGEAWARDQIRVNGIAPGLVPTKLTAVTTDNDARREASIKSIPMRRMGTPEDMAGVALFLASPMSAYVTGQTIVADGGLTLS
ncbi:MAG: SDR family oxidoreductase [Marinomonas sp.]